MDFAGPLPNKEIALVMWDQYARYPVVEFVTTTSARAVLPVLERVMANYGIPEEIKTDKRPPFNGREFTEFAEIHGFKHRKVTPRWAEANGDVIGVKGSMVTVRKGNRILCRNLSMCKLLVYQEEPDSGEE